jgi:hypothetical protein
MDISEKIKSAQGAEGEKLWEAVRLQHPEVLLSATLNRHLTEDMALFIIKSRKTPPEALGHLSNDVRFRDSYKCKLALAKNPRTPQRVAVSVLKHIKIFDLADITRDRRVPVMLRQKVELMLTERIPALPAGIKAALSRRASNSVVVRIMDKGDRKVIATCLESPLLTEEQLYRLVLREATKPLIIHVISEHPRWSLRYSLQYALIRNFHTPMRSVALFIENMKTTDLRALYDDPKVPSSTKPFVFRELRNRSETVETPEEIVYELPEEALEVDVNPDLGEHEGPGPDDENNPPA